MRDESGIGPIAAATLVVEVGDPFRFASESKFARWCGTGAVALSTGEGRDTPTRHRLDFGGNRRINSVLYVASITQHRFHPEARTYFERKITEGKIPTRRPPRTSDTSPTASSDACEKTKFDDSNKPSPPPLDKGASDASAPQRNPTTSENRARSTPSGGSFVGVSDCRLRSAA